MDDRWMRALLRPLDLLAFLSMTPVPSDARTPHPGRVPPARRPIPGRASDGDWTGNGVLDRFLEDESLFGEFLRTPVSEGGVEPLVVGPPHVVVEVGA